MVLAVDNNLLTTLAQSGRTSYNELLYIALLLALWLLLRVQRAERKVARPQRRAPANMHELGLVVFQTARGQDVDAFRGLFLAGREAHLVFGDKATRYLEQRDRATLAESLASIGALIPEGSRYDGVEEISKDTYAIRITPPVGDSLLVGIGTATRVGALWRLRDPPFTGDGSVPLPTEAEAASQGQGEAAAVASK